MAKLYGLNGVVSGRIGNTVYRVLNGIQVAAQYQPVVSNPKSSAQMLQRAKANLVGRISAITPREAIVGMGRNNRERRSEFLKNGIINTNSIIEDGVAVAKLEPSLLRFSKGTEIPMIVPLSNTITAGGSLTISYHRASGLAAEDWWKIGGTFVVVAIDPETGKYDFVRVVNWNKPSWPSTPETTLTQNILVEAITLHDVYVYFVPFSLDEQKGSTISKSIYIDTNDYAAKIGLTEAASNLKFGYSEYFGKAIPQE